MLNVFKSTPRLRGGVLRSSELAYVRRVMFKECDTVKAYYRKHYKRIENNHILVKLIKSFSLCRHLSDYEYAAYIQDASREMIRKLGFVDHFNKGVLHTGGVLLGPNTVEAVVCTTDNNENYYNSEERWEDLVPMRYLYHTRSDVNLPLMNNTTAGKGFGILAIDIPMLLVKYRNWVNDQSRTQDQIPGVAYFIGTQVLPDIVPSYLDIAVFNRCDLRYTQLPLRTYPSPHPFSVPDYTKQIDSLNEDTLKLTDNRSGDMGEILINIPLIFNDSAYELVQPAQHQLNYNTEWVYLLQILPFIYFAAKHKRTLTMSSTEAQQLLAHLRGMKSSRVFDTVGNNKEYSDRFYGIVDKTIDLLSN